MSEVLSDRVTEAVTVDRVSKDGGIRKEKITLLSPRENWCSGDEACIRRLQDALGAENVVLRKKT